MFSNFRYHYLHWRYAKRSQKTGVKSLYNTPFPPQSQKIINTKFTVVDCEMSGLNPRENELLSIGWTTIKNGKIVNSESGQVLIHSNEGSGESIKIHGLSDRDLANAVSLPSALSRLIAKLQNTIVVFHFAPIDLAFLQKASMQCFQCPLIFPYFDTLQIEKKRLALQGKSGGLRLHECRSRYNLDDSAQHNAMADAHATAELFIAQLHYSGDLENLQLSHLPFNCA